MHFDRLSAITKNIIDSKSSEEYVAAAETLSAFYKDMASGMIYSSSNEAIVKGGVALSSLGAADCVDDYLRTTFFIKGVYTTLMQLLTEYPNRPINVLYAGSGPYATLLLPLLPLIAPASVRAIVLDINQASLDSVQNMVEVIGLRNYHLTLECADATTYVVPKDFAIDLCISETMHYGLTREPQVAIIKNLAPQLPAHGILIPQQISIDIAFTSFSKEPYLHKSRNTEATVMNAGYASRVPLGRLFTISKEHFPDVASDGKFQSSFFTVPKNFESFPDVCLYTEVQVIEGISLKIAESYITNPYCVASLWNFAESESVRLVYDFSETPLWYCEPGTAYGLEG